jgi:hypothetical protein
MIAGAVLGIAGAIMASFTMAEYHRSLKGGIAHAVSVEKAPQLKDTFSFYFEDGEVLPFIGTNRVTIKSKNSTSHAYYYVAPVVPRNWSKGRPITLWVACKKDYNWPNACLPTWQKHYRAGYRVERIHEDEYRTAVQNATHRHGLTTVHGAPILHWVASPEQEMLRSVRKMMLLIYVLNGTWLLIAVGSQLYRFVKGRRSRLSARQR